LANVKQALGVNAKRAITRFGAVVTTGKYLS